MRNIQNWAPSILIKDIDKFRINLNHVSFRSRLVSKSSLQNYIEVIQKYSQGDLLDLGCGNVPYFEIYRDKVCSISCTDWSNSMHKNSHLDVISDLNSRIEFNNSCFDTIIFTDVLEHLSSPGVAMSEIHRVLRNGGCLIMAVPFMYSVHEEPYDFARYTRYGLVNLCKQAGLNVVEIRELGGALTVIGDIFGKIIPSKLFSITIQSIFWTIINTKLGRFIEDKTKSKFTRSLIVVASK